MCENRWMWENLDLERVEFVIERSCRRLLGHLVDRAMDIYVVLDSSEGSTVTTQPKSVGGRILALKGK